jgi:hypothetical protein
MVLFDRSFTYVDDSRAAAKFGLATLQAVGGNRNP